MAPLPPAKKLQPIDIGVCYHCDKKAQSNTFCANWRIWSCTACLQRHHRTHHKTCAVEIPKEELEANEAKYFTLWVTRYDGKKLSMSCRLGEKLEMEDHWMGTYIFAGTGMILVTEDRAAINEKILLGLKVAQ